MDLLTNRYYISYLLHPLPSSSRLTRYIALDYIRSHLLPFSDYNYFSITIDLVLCLYFLISQCDSLAGQGLPHTVDVFSPKSKGTESHHSFVAQRLVLYLHSLKNTPKLQTVYVNTSSITDQ